MRSEEPCEILTVERAEAILGGPVTSTSTSRLSERFQDEAKGDKTLKDLEGLHCVYVREGDESQVMFRIHLRTYASEAKFAETWDDEESEPLDGVGWAAVYESDSDGADKLITAMINKTQGIFTLGTYDAEDISKEELANFAAEIATRYVGGCPPKCGR